MRTDTEIQFSLVDVTARKDAKLTFPAQPFCDIARDLSLEEAPEPAKYGTLEKDQFLMDGSFALFPDFPEETPFWGAWSAVQSGEDGRFAAPPVLKIDFTKPHSSAGITLHFYETVATGVTIEWYADRLLRTARFKPDSADYFCRCKVENYTRLVLRFEALNRPGRYLKLMGIDYGARLVFTGKNLIAAHLLEEVDVLSNEMSVNTLNLTVHDGEGTFRLLNPDGMAEVLQHRQPLTAREWVNGSWVALGKFYLSEWENTTGGVAKLTATDAIGLLDEAAFDGGVFDTTAGVLAARILDGVSYTLDDSLSKERITGILKPCTRREALQQLAFALGAVVDTSRSEVIHIYPPPERPTALLGNDRIFLGGTLALRAAVTEVAVTAHSWQLGEAKEIYKGTLDVGEHRISLSDAAENLSASGAELLDAGAFYAVVTVKTPGEVILTGRPYVETTTVYRQKAEGIPANAPENLLEVKDALLVGPARAPAVAERLLRYAQQRYEANVRFVAKEEKPADCLLLPGLRGVLEKLELDLAGGFTAQARLVGQPVAAAAESYAGEFRAPERGWV